MLEIQNSRDRELDEWRGLFTLADRRFKFVGAKQPPGSILWFLVAVWEPEAILSYQQQQQGIGFGPEMLEDHFSNLFEI